LDRGYTGPDAGLPVDGYQAPVAGPHAAIQAPGVLQLLGPAQFPDAGSSQRRPDGLTFKSADRLTVDENFNFPTAGNPAFNTKIFFGWFHKLLLLRYFLNEWIQFYILFLDMIYRIYWIFCFINFFRKLMKTNKLS